MDITQLQCSWLLKNSSRRFHTPIRFDANAYIADGHFAVKVDCDKDGKGIVSVATGAVPDLKIIPLTVDNMVHELFTRGQMCIYHVDLPSEKGMKVTDLAVINTSNHEVRLGKTATAVIHVHSYGEPIEEYEGHDGSMKGMK